MYVLQTIGLPLSAVQQLRPRSLFPSVINWCAPRVVLRTVGLIIAIVIVIVIVIVFIQVTQMLCELKRAQLAHKAEVCLARHWA